MAYISPVSRVAITSHSSAIFRQSFFHIKHTNNLNLVHKRNFSVVESLGKLAATQSSWFKSLAESTPVAYTQNLLENIHENTNLPWWATIIVTTVSLRLLITFPLAVYQNYIFAKVENLKPEMDSLVKELKRETAIAIKKFNWTEKEARLAYNRSAKKMWNGLIVKENCHPFKASILLWAQIPLWVCMSVALRNMATMFPFQTAEAQVVFMQLSCGGFGWIPNLTDVDHSFILPVAMALTNLAIIELQSVTKLRPTSKFQRGVKNVFRGLCVLMVPVAAAAPADVALYWTVSSLFGLVQNLVILSPSLRRYSGIPKTPSELEKPYASIAERLKTKLRL